MPHAPKGVARPVTNRCSTKPFHQEKLGRLGAIGPVAHSPGPALDRVRRGHRRGHRGRQRGGAVPGPRAAECLCACWRRPPPQRLGERGAARTWRCVCREHQGKGVRGRLAYVVPVGAVGGAREEAGRVLLIALPTMRGSRSHAITHTRTTARMGGHGARTQRPWPRLVGSIDGIRCTLALGGDRCHRKRASARSGLAVFWTGQHGGEGSAGTALLVFVFVWASVARVRLGHQKPTFVRAALHREAFVCKRVCARCFQGGRVCPGCGGRAKHAALAWPGCHEGLVPLPRASRRSTRKHGHGV